MAFVNFEKHKDGVWVTKLVDELTRSESADVVQIVAIEDFLHETLLDDAFLPGCHGIINRVSDAADADTVKRCVALLTTARLYQIPVFNGPISYSLCCNKWCHHAVFLRAGLASPSTAIVLNNRLSSDERLITASQRLLPTPLPHLVKPNSGGFGAGIVKLEQDDNARDDPTLTTDDSLLLLQSYVPPADGRIYRVWFLLGRVQCAVERISVVGSDEFTVGCAGGVCSRAKKPPLISAWPVPATVRNEIEHMLGFLQEDAHAGSVEFLLDESGQRLYFDLNLLSTLPLEVLSTSGVWSDDYNPWSELADAVVSVLNAK